MTDYTIDDVIFLPFTTRAFATGVPTVFTGSPTVEVWENAAAQVIVEGASKLVLTIDLNSLVGLNMATVTLSAANGFEAGKHYSLIIKTGTVGGVNVFGEVVGTFTIAWAAAAVDLANGTDGLTALAADIATAQTDLDTLTGTDGATLATTQGNYAPATVAALAIAQTDLDTLTDASGEPAQGAPAVSLSMKDKIAWLYKTLRNRKTSTATLINIYNDDATTVDHKKVTSDDGTTYDEGEMTTGA